MKETPNYWSLAYWVLVINQIVIIGPLTLLTSATVHESYQACKAASVFVPSITKLYFAVGPYGILLAGAASVAVSLMMAGLRKRLAGVLVASVSFVGCVAFLGGAFCAAIVPLLVLVRNMLPPDQRW